MEAKLLNKISKEAGLTQEEKELLVEISKLPSIRDIIGDEIYNISPEEETEFYRKFIFNEEFITRAKKLNLIMASAGIIILLIFFLFMGLTNWRDLLPKDSDWIHIISGLIILWIMVGVILTFIGIADYWNHSKTEKVLKKIKEISEKYSLKP